MCVLVGLRRVSCSLLRKYYNLIMTQEIAPVQYNFKIFDFAPICKEISRRTLIDIEKYGFLSNPKFSKDVKRLLMHHTIHCICEFFIKNKKRVPIVLYYEMNSYFTKLHAFYGSSDVSLHLHKIILTVCKILPVRIYISCVPFNLTKAQIDKNTGEGVDFLKSMEYRLQQYDFSSYTFSKIKLYTNRHKLIFLNNEYFNQLKTKNLLFA